MNQSLTRIYFYTTLSVFLTSPFLLSQTKLFAKQEAVIINEKSNLDDSRNRFPEILHDVKILLSEVLIADHHLDTLEVIYNLSRIYDLLMEADQIGEMNLEDKEEFDRFNRTFTELYTHNLVSVQSINAPVMAEKMWAEISEAIEIEMGETKLIVVEDRDGHVPLVRTKHVDQ